MAEERKISQCLEGRDEYGPWKEFSVKGVVQRMRWIEPGSFLMGPPEDADEGQQHEVRIAEGFWLFDTACTQALWEAVMGENPSFFKGARRPVELVSWDDVQRFIAALNDRIPGLGLSLPSEAQWEYACRAGTETPFSFGADITPEQVNYDGRFPYTGGAVGEYRGETVPVGSLPANPWGLYEMHGNVWEWVRDAWHNDYKGAPADGSARESDADGAVRVLRGGSWYNEARGCRCTCRSGALPGGRGDDLGFRCAEAVFADEEEREKMTEMTRERLHIVISGNPVDGFTHFGPFDGVEEASDWADNETLWEDPWWVDELRDPDNLG